MRVRSWIKLQVSDDAEGKQCLFARNQESLEEVVDDNETFVESGIIRLGAGATDVSIGLGSISTTQYVYLESVSAFQYKFNSLLNAVTNVTKPEVGSGTIGRARLFMSTDLTALWLSNPDLTDPQDIYFCIVGS